MQKTNKKLNSAKGINSYDAELSDGSIIPFFNKNISPYPTDVSAPKFDLIPVKDQKDRMINTARLHAQQEYDRIMELVNVLQKQALDIKKRLDLTDLIHSAEYKFQIFQGHCYWLVKDQEITRLVILGPNDWSGGPPRHYKYITRVQWLGDSTWIEVTD